MKIRSNVAWLQALSEQQTAAKEEALRDLREYLLRSVLVYLSMHRSELTDWSRPVIRQLAEDLAQDALLKILQNLEQFRGESKFTTWAYRFVINQAATELRARRYRDLSLDQLLQEESLAFESLHQAWQPLDLGRQIEQRAYIELLRTLVDQELTERQRAAIVGIYLLEYSTEEVAAALGTDRNTLYKVLHDARKRLKAALLSRHLTPNDILAAFDG